MTHTSEPHASNDELPGACELGATSEELQALFRDRLPVFRDWMRGQPLGVCPEHGEVVYQYDLERLLAGSWTLWCPNRYHHLFRLRNA